MKPAKPSLSATATDSSSGINDPRLVKVLKRCLHDFEQGQQLDREQILAAHPEIATALAQCLDALEFVYSVAPQIGGVQLPDDQGSTGEVTRIPGRFAVGDFKLNCEIGRGGMGMVYLAEQLSLGRQVALKVLPFAAMLDPRQLERFKNEARAAALLHHPHIVPIYSVSSDRGVYYYAMQYVDGRTLAELIDELKASNGKTSSPRTLNELAGVLETRNGDASSTDLSINRPQHFRALARIALQAAEALEHAHQLGVTHRDIKPSNLMIDRSGHLWVTDFGLARIENAGDLTMTGDVLGTLRYMSPEQALGSPLPVDHRTDVYSLGVTLYEMLTLEPAIKGRDRKEALHAIESQEPMAPRRVNPAIPRQLETIVLKAIAKNRDSRYVSADAFARDIERFLRDEPILARHPSALQKLGAFSRRHRGAVMAGTIASLLLLVASIVGLSVGNRLISHERDRAETQKGRAELAEAEAQIRLFKSLLSEAELARQAGQGGRFRGLKAISDAAAMMPGLSVTDSDLQRCRNAAVAALALTDLRLDSSFNAYPDQKDHTGIAFDRAMQRYACPIDDGKISVRRIQDNVELFTLKISDQHSFSTAGLRFSPDGRFLATQGSQVHNIPARVWDLEQQRSCLAIGPVAARTAMNLDFSPDSKSVAVVRQDWSIVLYDIQSGQETKLIQLDKEITSIRFDPLGKYLACCMGDLQLLNVRTGKMTRVAPLNEATNIVALVEWHPEGEKLATAGVDNAVHIWEASSGKLLRSFRDHETNVASLAFNHRGDLLATACWDGRSHLWDTASGERILSVDGYASRFSADDRWLGMGSIGSTIGRWQVGRSTGYRSMRGSRSERSTVDFALDDTFVAACGDQGIHFSDPASAQALGTLDVGPCQSIVFHPNGTGCYVASRSGLSYWPISTRETALDRIVRLGPPEVLLLPEGFTPNWCRVDAAGRVLMVKTFPDRVFLIDCTTHKIIRQSEQTDIWFAQISPDAKWIAAANWHQSSGVWDTQRLLTRQMWPIHRARFAFSPDSDRLVVGSYNSFQVRETESWEVIKRLERAPNSTGTTAASAFSPDGSMLAVASSNRAVELYDAHDFRRLAGLTPPGEGIVNWIDFNHDGSKLAVLCHNGLVHLWDLPRLREQLREMDLDWDPPSQIASGFGAGVRSTRVEIDYGHLQRELSSRH